VSNLCYLFSAGTIKIELWKLKALMNGKD